MGITHNKIIEEVKDAGIECTKLRFSRAIRGLVHSENAESICRTADKILSEKEKRLGI